MLPALHEIALDGRNARLAVGRHLRAAGFGRFGALDQGAGPRGDPFAHIGLDLFARQAKTAADRGGGILRVDRLDELVDRDMPFECVEICDGARLRGAKTGRLAQLRPLLGADKRIERRRSDRLADRTATRTAFHGWFRVADERLIHGG